MTEYKHKVGQIVRIKTGAKPLAIVCGYYYSETGRATYRVRILESALTPSDISEVCDESDIDKPEHDREYAWTYECSCPRCLFFRIEQRERERRMFPRCDGDERRGV